MLRLLRARKTLKQRERRGTSRAIYNSWKIPYRESLCHPNPNGRRPPGQASFSSAGRPDTSEGIAQPMWDRWPMQVQMGQWSPLSTLVHIRMRVVAEDPNLEPEEQGIASPPDSVYPDALQGCWFSEAIVRWQSPETVLYKVRVWSVMEGYPPPPQILPEA